MSGILDARPKVGYLFTGKTNINYVSDAISSIVVEKIMSVPIVMEEDKSIYDGIVLMFTEDVGSIYITNKGILTGVVSRKDLLKSAMGGMDLNKTPISLIMTRMPNLVTIKRNDLVLSASIRMIQHEIDSLPVVETVSKNEKEYKVVGRITKTTITRLFVELGTNI